MMHSNPGQTKPIDSLPIDPHPDPERSCLLARARELDRAYQLAERQSDLHRIEQLVPRLFADRPIVQLVCGTGYWTRLLAKSASHVVATDPSEEALAIVESRGFDPARVSLFQADPCALPDGLGRFEGAFAAHWWSQVPVQRRHACLASLTRRLVPGSKIVFIDHCPDNGRCSQGLETDLHGNTWRTIPAEDGSDQRVIDNYPSFAEIRIDLQQHGQILGILEMQHYRVVAWLTQKIDH